jgi:hypothetical protein
MKKADIVILAAVILVFLPFFLFPAILREYRLINAEFPYLASFIKFAILATFGECLGLRIRTGRYWQQGFGLVPRAIVWGFLGITIKMAFVIFGEGGPLLLKTLGVHFPAENPADILREPGFSWLKLLAAFSVGTTMNLFFAPVFMAVHRITDMHIQDAGGHLKNFFRPVRVGTYFREMDWYSFWNFVVKKTIPIFWIPAQTLNFMLPEEYRILVAALYSVILGVLLSVASLMAEKRL